MSLLHNETSSTTWINQPSALPAELATVCILLNVYILLTNVFVVLTFRRMGTLDPRHIYMLGLVGSDILTLVINSIGAGIAINGELNVAQYQCDALGIASTSAVEITSTIHSVMCVDRWYSVVAPVKYRAFKTKRKSKLYVILILCLAFLLPVAVNVVSLQSKIVSFYFEPYIPNCVVGPSSDHGRIVGLAVSTGLFVGIPITIQASTNGYMLYKVSRLQKINRRHIFKSVKTVLTTVLVFYVCWMPTAIWLLWIMITGHTPNGWYTFVSIQMLVSNSGMSFPIYMCTLNKFREHFPAAIRWPWLHGFRRAAGTSKMMAVSTSRSRTSTTEESSL